MDGGPRLDLGGGRRFLFVADGDDAEILDLGDGESQGRARLSGFDSQTLVTTESLIAIGEDGAAAFDLDDLEERGRSTCRTTSARRPWAGRGSSSSTADELVAYG